MPVSSNPGNSKDIDKKKKDEQSSSDDLTSTQKQTEKEQDKSPGRYSEVVERESPEVTSTPDRDPRVN